MRAVTLATLHTDPLFQGSAASSGPFYEDQRRETDQCAPWIQAAEPFSRTPRNRSNLMRKSIRMVAALLLLPSGAVYAQPLGGSGSRVVSCASSFVDGCPDAPVAAIQVPTILSHYATRPPWKVAGLDYAVGVPAGAVLRDPGAVGVIPSGDTINIRKLGQIGGSPAAAQAAALNPMRQGSEPSV